MPELAAGKALARRSFLKSTGAAAGAIAAQRAPAFAQGEARRKFRIGFIGMGRRGRSNLQAALERDDIEVAAISEIYEPNIELALAMAPGVKVYRDFRDLLADPSIDAVNISTPDHWHAYMTVEACKASKDVYVEKPISVTVHEGRMMVEAARKYGRVVQVGTQQRSALHFQRAVELVRNGRIGDISFVRTWNYANMAPEGIGSPPDSAPPPDLDWDMWLGPAPERRFNSNRFGVNPDSFSHFRSFWDYAGGMMTDWGVHLVDIVLWAMEEKGPRAINTFGGKYVLEDNRETPDTLLASYEFPDFVCVYENRVANAQSMFDRRYGILFHGSNGTLFVDRQRWEILPEKRRIGGRGSREEVDRISPEQGQAVNNSTAAHWEDFVHAMRSRERPISDIENGHRSTAMALLGNVSLRSRQRVDWDPESETTSNAEARTYLRREYRAPWKLEL